MKDHIVKQGASAVERRLIIPFLALAILAGVAGCLRVTLVEDYDPVIDTGLQSYDESINGFLNRMEQLAGEDAGKYSRSPEIPRFYAEQRGKLQALEDRAAALGGKECLPAVWGSEGIERLLDQTVDIAADFKDEDLFEDIAKGLEQLQNESADAYKDKSCTQIVLFVVTANHQLLELIHKDEDKLEPEVAGPARDLVRQGVRIAMKNESAKRR